MSSVSSSYKTIHPSPLPREHAPDSVGLILSQNGLPAQEQGQMLSSDLGLIEMTEVEYSNLQHYMQGRAEVQAEGLDARSHPAVRNPSESTLASPLTSTQAIDLSVSSDDHCMLMSVEKTPVSYGEVPGFVLARINGEDSPSKPLAKVRKSLQNQSMSSARVCLEKRFNSMCPDTTRPQEIHPALLSNLLTVLHQSGEPEETVLNPQRQKWLKADRENPMDVPVGYMGGVVDPLCGQVLAQAAEANKHPGLIISKSFSFHFHPENILPKHIYSNVAEEQQLVNFERDLATSAVYRNHCSIICTEPGKDVNVSCPVDSAKESQRATRKRARSLLSHSQRRERHNITERERRKRIRLCCDELNTMVPFCDSYTDKVTTLTWTTTFLKYINKKYGDTFKEEFQKLFAHKKGNFLKSNPSLGQHPLPDLDEALDTSLAAEQ